MTKLDFIIPILNEEQSIPSLIDRLDGVARQAQDEFELDVGYVFVDDGSVDGGFGLLMAHDFGARRVRLRRLSRNFGKEAALSAGIEAAHDVDVAILMDADLQQPPEVALDFIRVWRDQGADSVYAYKSFRRQEEGWAKDLMSRGFYWTINQNVRYHIPENAQDFRLINRVFMDALLCLPESERFMKGLYGWIGFRQIGVPFRPDLRSHGESKFPPRKLLLMTMDAMTSFSVVPLRFMALTGITISCFSILYGLFIVIERIFFLRSGIGIASALVLISFFGGMQMIFLGLLGEYVGKAVLEAKRRPNYIVAQDVIRDGHGSR